MKGSLCLIVNESQLRLETQAAGFYHDFTHDYTYYTQAARRRQSSSSTVYLCRDVNRYGISNRHRLDFRLYYSGSWTKYGATHPCHLWDTPLLSLPVWDNDWPEVTCPNPPWWTSHWLTNTWMHVNG